MRGDVDCGFDRRHPSLKLQRQVGANLSWMVRLTEDVRRRIEAVAGPNRMAAFTREAIEGELQRREAVSVLRESASPTGSAENE
jgi:hypothetical protein